MNTWYKKQIGAGPRAFTELKRLRGLCQTLIGYVETPYQLAIDAETGDTVVYFKPEHAALAKAFTAHPCAEPAFASGDLLPLPYESLPIAWDLT